LGVGAASTGLLLGTEVSLEPLSNLPLRWVGGVGVPSFGMARGPPGPLPAPMLLFEDPPSRISSNCTEIGVSSVLATGKVTARSASKKSIV
jgi:hypothetical protein